MPDDRAALVRRGLRLNWLTIAYNVIEAVVSMAAGVISGSVALVGFGVDSAIEVTASAAAQWRLRADVDVQRRQHIETQTGRMIGLSFLALAIYVTYESAETLWHHAAPERSTAGIVILTVSLMVMPLLARVKRTVATGLQSQTLHADATQTSLCAYLSVIALAGVVLNRTLGWWWADPLAALAMVPIMLREGLEGIRGESHCATCTD